MSIILLLYIKDTWNVYYENKNTKQKQKQQQTT